MVSDTRCRLPVAALTLCKGHEAARIAVQRARTRGVQPRGLLAQQCLRDLVPLRSHHDTVSPC